MAMFHEFHVENSNNNNDFHGTNSWKMLGSGHILELRSFKGQVFTATCCKDQILPHFGGDNHYLTMHHMAHLGYCTLPTCLNKKIYLVTWILPHFHSQKNPAQKVQSRTLKYITVLPIQSVQKKRRKTKNTNPQSVDGSRVAPLPATGKLSEAEKMLRFLSSEITSIDSVGKFEAWNQGQIDLWMYFQGNHGFF